MDGLKRVTFGASRAFRLLHCRPSDPVSVEGAWVALEPSSATSLPFLPFLLWRARAGVSVRQLRPQGALHRGPCHPLPACYGGSSTTPVCLGWWPPSPPCCDPPPTSGRHRWRVAGGRRSRSTSSSAVVRPCRATSPRRPTSPRPPGGASCRVGVGATCCTCWARGSMQWWGGHRHRGHVPWRVPKVHAVPDLGVPGGHGGG
jgi:hypothetical protein